MLGCLIFEGEVTGRVLEEGTNLFKEPSYSREVTEVKKRRVRKNLDEVGRETGIEIILMKIVPVLQRFRLSVRRS